jgi:hypothetical protein
MNDIVFQNTHCSLIYMSSCIRLLKVKRDRKIIWKTIYFADSGFLFELSCKCILGEEHSMRTWVLHTIFRNWIELYFIMNWPKSTGKYFIKVLNFEVVRLENVSNMIIIYIVLIYSKTLQCFTDLQFVAGLEVLNESVHIVSKNTWYLHMYFL